jgi:chorismate-pyruvate lyase
VAGFEFLAALTLASAPAAAPTLDQFEARLAANPSATAVLETWCREHFDPAATVRASVISTSSSSPTGRIRRELAIGDADRLSYRRVSLQCSGRELSLAYNWYVPERLTPEMNRVLAETDQPFGRVAAPLGYTRERLRGERGTADFCPAGTILTHRALLRLPDGRPLALVVECYTGAILAP